jgi:hypothetical protein
MNNFLKTTVVIAVVLLAGCASHRVHCEGHLKPINAPAPATPAGGQS